MGGLAGRTRHGRFDIGIAAAAGIVVGISVFAQSGGNWNPPPSGTPPPGGNLPGVIWNSVSAGVQQNASIDVSGGINAGGGIAANNYGVNPDIGVLGVNAAFGDLVTGLVLIGQFPASMVPMNHGDFVATGHTALGGYLPDANFTATMPNAYFGDGVKGAVIGAYPTGGIAAGDIGADGTVYGAFFSGDGSQLSNIHCAAPKFVGLTTTAYTGNVGSYAAANLACASAFAGSHMCTPDEISRTIACSPAILPASANAWVANGPPGFTSPAANDCGGWTSAAGTSYGTFWQFAGSAGGKGFATACNLSLKLGCCR